MNDLNLSGFHSEIWQRFVGSESPRTFREAYPGPLDEAVLAYLNECPSLFNEPDLWEKVSISAVQVSLMDTIRKADA